MAKIVIKIYEKRKLNFVKEIRKCNRFCNWCMLY